MQLHGIAKNFSEEICSKGVATIKRFSIDEEHARFHNTQMLFSGGRWFQRVDAGEYVKLIVNGELMMSDTRMERTTNEEFIEKAHGHVMIAGLGLGLIIDNLRDKITSGEVTDIVVYEKYQDVIDLVLPKYKDLPIKVIKADILKYKPIKGEKYDTIYFDIWPEIAQDNLPQMAMLHQRWKMRKNKGGWMGSWMQDFLRNQRRNEQRSSYWW